MEALPDPRQSERFQTSLSKIELEAMLARELQRRLIPVAYFTEDELRNAPQLAVRRERDRWRVDSVDIDPPGDQFPQFPVIDSQHIGKGS